MGKAIISLNLGLPPEAELFLEKIFFIFLQLFRTEKYLENKKFLLKLLLLLLLYYVSEK